MATFYTPTDPGLRGTQAHHLLQNCIDGVAQTAIDFGISEVAVRRHFIVTRGHFDHVLRILNQTLQLDEATLLPAEESPTMAGLPFPPRSNRLLPGNTIPHTTQTATMGGRSMAGVPLTTAAPAQTPANTIPHTTQTAAVSSRNMAGLPFTTAAPAQTRNKPVQLEDSVRPTVMPSDDFVANSSDAGRRAEHGTQDKQTNTMRNNSEHQSNVTSPVPASIEEPAVYRGTSDWSKSPRQRMFTSLPMEEARRNDQSGVVSMLDDDCMQGMGQGSIE